MSIRVEFFGIPRERAGCGSILVAGATLGEVLLAVELQIPALRPDCLGGGHLSKSCIANLDGKSFCREPETPVPQGSTVLILSADVGG